MLPDMIVLKINYQSTCVVRSSCRNDNQLTKLTGDARMYEDVCQFKVEKKAREKCQSHRRHVTKRR